MKALAEMLAGLGWRVTGSDLQPAGATAEAIRRLAVLSQPFMPASSANILDQLAVDAGARDFARALAPGVALTPGAPLPAPSAVFPRFIDSAL